MTARAISHRRATLTDAGTFTFVALDSTERHLRRKLITLSDGEEVLVDFAVTARLGDGDWLELDDGRRVQVKATAEDLLEVKGRDAAHLVQLAWHIGNRHLEAQIEAGRILIRRDHVIAQMLAQLGATLAEVREVFQPEHGAYSHGH